MKVKPPGLGNHFKGDASSSLLTRFVEPAKQCLLGIIIDHQTSAGLYSLKALDLANNFKCQEKEKALLVFTDKNTASHLACPLFRQVR